MCIRDRDHTVGQGAGTVIRHLSAVQDALDVRGADRVLVGIQNQDGLLRNAGGESAGGSVGTSGHVLHVPDILVVGVAVNQLGELLVAVDSHGAVVELHGIAGQNVGAAAAGGSQIRHALAVHGVGIGSLKMCIRDRANTLAGTGDYSDLMVIPDLELSVEEYGIGFRQGSDLTAAVNQALSLIHICPWGGWCTRR